MAFFVYEEFTVVDVLPWAPWDWSGATRVLRKGFQRGFCGIVGGSKQVRVVTLGRVSYPMSLASPVQTRKSLVLWLLFPANASGDGIYDSIFINQNSINPFLIVFFKIGIRTLGLGVLWSCFSVHISHGTVMDSAE